MFAANITSTNLAIIERMKATGLTFDQVKAELEMMAAAKRRYETGKLTAEDRKEIRRGTRDFYDRGGHCWRGR